MKKVFLVSLIAILCAASLFAGSQKIYPVGSEIMDTIKALYLVTGHAAPSATGPWSADELLKMLDKIDASEVPSYLKADYEAALDELTKEPEHQWDGIGATFTNNLNLQLGLHTNNDSEIKRTDKTGNSDNSEQLFIGRDNWSSDYLHTIEPLYALEWETWAAEHFYAFFEFGLFNSYNGNADNSYGTSKLSTNIFMLQNLKFEPGWMDANMPYRGFVSAGGEHWSLQVGRDRISWGNGKTGNLAVSDNMLYQNMARFTTYSDKYKYTFMTSFFPHPVNYYRSGTMNYSTSQDGLDGLSMYIAHRIEGRFLEDRLNLTLTEAITYESKNNHIDLGFLNPVFIFHNCYTPDVANSTLIFEADGTPVNGLNLYGQLLVDEFAIPLIETGAKADNRSTPNRYGFLLGSTYATGLADGLLSVNAEYAQLDPYVYIRHNCASGEGSSYGLDYVVAVRTWSTALPGITYDEKWLGYTYGPDCKVLNLNASYNWGDLSLELNFLNMKHGTHDQWTKSTDTGGEGEEAWQSKSRTCTTEHESGSWRYTDAEIAARNAVINLTDIGFCASYDISANLNAYAQADYVLIKNAYNRLGADDSDFQVVTGVRYSF